MVRKHAVIYITSSAMLFLILACVTTPAVSVPTQQSISTTDPNAFATMVAQAAGALMTQTAEAAPAMSSPIPTEPPATETPAPTPTATPVTSVSGTSLTQLEDGSTQFIDNVAGVRLSIPAGWVAVRLNEAEYFQVWSLTVDDPVLQYALAGIQNLDPTQYRLQAFNTQPDYVYEGQGTQISFKFVMGDARALEQVAEDEKQPKVFPEYALISSEFQVRPDNLQLFSIQEQWQGISSTNTPLTLYYKGFSFKVSSGTVTVELTMPFNINYEVVPAFDQMISEMSVFTP